MGLGSRHPTFALNRPAKPQIMLEYQNIANDELG